MTRQQVEVMVRRRGDEFNARLRLQDCDDQGNFRVFETDLAWEQLGRYCDLANVDKYKVAAQEINDPTLYDQLTVGADTLQRFNFRDVTSQWGPTRTRVVHERDLQNTIDECRMEGYKLTNVSSPNNARQITAVLERSST